MRIFVSILFFFFFFCFCFSLLLSPFFLPLLSASLLSFPLFSAFFFSFLFFSFLLLSVSFDGLFDLFKAIAPSENLLEAITIAGSDLSCIFWHLNKAIDQFLEIFLFHCFELCFKHLQKKTFYFIQHDL